MPRLSGQTRPVLLLFLQHMPYRPRHDTAKKGREDFVSENDGDACKRIS